ncbi:MAG: MraY family glycosyltransferase [Alphaproteobacteria bacterium]
MNQFVFPVGVFVAVAVLIPVLIRLAPVLKLVDLPDERKQHEGAVPLIGGLAIFPVFIMGAIFTGHGVVGYWPLYAAILLLLVTGAIDDKFHIRPWIKFMMQFIAAALVVFAGGAELSHLGDIFGMGVLELGFMSGFFSWIAVVLLINAVNLMDGLDGLAGGYSAVALGWIWFGFYSVGQSDGLLLLLIAGIGGFLVYNLRSPIRAKAALFLGDAGSMCLGLCLGWFAIGLGKVGGADVPAIAIAWVLAIPIMDTCAQFYRRAREGRHPFSPDRGHFHHHFIDAGFRDGVAVFLILSLAVILGAFGVVGVQLGVPQIVLSSIWIVMILAHMWVSEKPHRYVSFWGKFAPKS